MMLRKLFLAAVVLFTASTAFAKSTPADMGTTNTASSCDGVLLTSTDALGFNTTFGVTIVVTSQIVALNKLIPEAEQVVSVGALNRLDKIVEAKSDAQQCWHVTSKEATMLVHHMKVMTDLITATRGGPEAFDEVMLMLTKNDRKKAEAMLDSFNKVLRLFLPLLDVKQL